VDYISHLDALNSEANANILASWSNYSNLNREADSLVEQLQTTLDVEQLLSIYLSALLTIKLILSNLIHFMANLNPVMANPPRKR
jgi:hypothetical protein